MEHLAILDDDVTRHVLSVSWDSSSLCNYRCTYCDDWFHDGRHGFPPVDTVVEFLRDLEKHSGKKLYLEMKGGEPTLWKHIDAFLKACRENDWGLGIVTNGSRPLSWWEQNLNGITDVTLSLHPQFYDLDSIIEKIKYIDDRRVLLVFALAYPPLFEKLQRDVEVLLKMFPDLFLKMAVVAMPHAYSQIYENTPEQQAFMNAVNGRPLKKLRHELKFYPRSTAKILDADNVSRDFDVQALKMENGNGWAGWRCHAGLDRIHIDTSGEIFRGQCRQGGSFGNIHKKNWSLPSEPVICGKERCFCGGEVLLRKWNPQKITLLPPT